MKLKFAPKKWWFLLFTPLLIQGVCSKGNEDVVIPNADEYVTWKVRGANSNLKAPTDSLSFSRPRTFTAIYGSNKSANTSDIHTHFGISFDGPQQSGSYQASNFYVIRERSKEYYILTSTPLQVNVTTYGATERYIIGTYSGNVKDSTTGAIVAISGGFRIKTE